MVASAVFALIMGSVIVLYVFSARATSGVSMQLQFGSQARVLNFMANEIKSATQVVVQNYDGTSFSSIAAGNAQQGNALSLTVPYGTTTNQVLYWLNFTGTPTGTLYRAVVNSNNSKKVFNNITNAVPFALKSFDGSVASNQTQRTLVSIDLYAYDPNTKNFRQTMQLHSSVEKRN